MTELGVISGRHETLVEAVAVLEAGEAAFLLSRARLALGEHPDTPSGEAVALLRDALDGAVACGAQGVAGQACGALRRLGQHATDVPAREPRPTATQQRVAALAECGMDIPEIAQALFLTPQTVHAVLGELAAEGAR
jgi:DNA-binding NarL/FixJ family response regulator